MLNNIQMQNSQLKEEGRQGSKEQQSRNMNLRDEEHQKEMSGANIGSELTSISHKNQQRKVSEQEITFLMQEFALNRNKAVNLLKKMDLKQAVKYLVHS